MQFLYFIEVYISETYKFTHYTLICWLFIQFLSRSWCWQRPPSENHTFETFERSPNFNPWFPLLRWKRKEPKPFSCSTCCTATSFKAVLLGWGRGRSHRFVVSSVVCSLGLPVLSFCLVYLFKSQICSEHSGQCVHGLQRIEQYRTTLAIALKKFPSIESTLQFCQLELGFFGFLDKSNKSLGLPNSPHWEMLKCARPTRTRANSIRREKTPVEL